MGFEVWDGVHDAPDQKKRIASAKSASCTPLSIVPDASAGSFSGSYGVYETTLETCTCVDFVRRKLPCKHIYRLAIELGAMDGEVQSDAAQVKKPLPRGYSLKEAVDILEELGDGSLEVLRSVLYLKFYRKKAEAVGVVLCDDLTRLVDAGVLVACDDPAALLGAYRRNELCDRLIGAGVSGFKKNAKLDDLIYWICENVPAVPAIFSDAVAVRVADDFLKASRKIYTYLRRRLEVDSYLDPDRGNVEYPAGAEFCTTVSLSGDVTFSPVFPDDEITELLDLHGVNRCRTWQLPPKEGGS